MSSFIKITINKPAKNLLLGKAQVSSDYNIEYSVFIIKMV
jgi:hypothetical protein